MHGASHNFEIVFVLLFAIATTVAILARWLKIPYTVALVLSGLLLGMTDFINPPQLTMELLYAIFLPGLLFEAAFHVEFKKFWNNKFVVSAMAIPGLLMAIGLTAFLLLPIAEVLKPGFNFTYALVFAALIAATDPIAVVGLFKSLGAPKRLAILVEGESLINDGTAVVVFTLVLKLAAGSQLSFGDALGQFVLVAGTGATIGLLFGFAVSWLTHQIEEPMIEITLTTIAAYGAFAVAEHFHVSGVIATVVAGMLCGNYGARTGMSASTKIAVLAFWEYWAFALNSIVFLLIGFAVDPLHLLHAWKPILLAFGAVMLARVVVVYMVTALFSKSSEKIPWKWSAVLTWGGLRGGLSMVLALVVANHPEIDKEMGVFIVNLTYGVVVLSILIQGLTMKPLLQKLGIVSAQEKHESYELNRSRLMAAKSALNEIKKMRDRASIPVDVIDQLERQYNERALKAQEAIESLRIETADLFEQERLSAARTLLMIEKEMVMDNFQKGEIGKEVFEILIGQLDARALSLEDDYVQGSADPQKEESQSSEA